MAYVGYQHDYRNLPISRGQEVVIPKGATVKSMHPSRDSFVTVRKMKVKVHHLLPGASMSLHIMRRKDRIGYEERFAAEFAAFDWLREEMKNLEGDDLKAAYDLYMEAKIAVQNPQVCWPGAGGYWNEVDINTVIAANQVAA